MTSKLSMLLALLWVCAPAQAWIAYGFQSGMSRFDVARYLSEAERYTISEGDQQTFAVTDQNEVQYDLVYCSTPQRLYLMKYRLDDTEAEFVRTLKKFEKRYGKPEGLDDVPAYLETTRWEEVDLSLIWDLNESETILLTRGNAGSSAEFQDISICR